ncbi:hypothetical protein [Yoonia sp. I 8.24]|uniref:hypothetical protein n=1 Tax=Yoonia sp. I 8.24 TaxID=1537229 RepID=UPI001EDF0499|nr:hypothetical protein [Yoonia sp. I 8.24]MCG3266683.1 hypothetical protein [Yoonia sp. I 8.24]
MHRDNRAKLTIDVGSADKGDLEDFAANDCFLEATTLAKSTGSGKEPLAEMRENSFVRQSKSTLA